MAHPTGFVRLGIDADTGRPCDLSIEKDLMKGGAVYGVTGSGKSTALLRLADGALASGATVVVLDGKGPALRSEMETAARDRGVPFYLLDAADPGTYLYDPLEGSPAQISNRLMGGLIPTASGDAAIYKMLVQGAAPHILGGLQRVGRCSLRELQRVLADPSLLAQLAREVGDDDLRDLAAQASKDRLLISALGGMSGRLRALTAGFFRPLLEGARPRYSWTLTQRTSVTVLSLPSLEAQQDSALIARVFLSGVAQMVAERHLALQRGEELPPLLLICDELTALSASDPEIEQRVLALLLQARASRVAVTVAGQTLPEDPVARKAIVGTGLLLSLRLTAADSEVMSAEYGTEESTSLTHQIEQGQLSGSGTASLSHAYRMHPQQFRSLPVGEGLLIVPPAKPRRVHIAQDSSPIPSTLAGLLGSVLPALRRRLLSRNRN